MHYKLVEHHSYKICVVCHCQFAVECFYFFVSLLQKVRCGQIKRPVATVKSGLFCVDSLVCVGTGKRCTCKNPLTAKEQILFLNEKNGRRPYELFIIQYDLIINISGMN